MHVPPIAVKPLLRFANKLRSAFAKLAGWDSNRIPATSIPLTELETTDKKKSAAGYGWALLACILTTLVSLLLRSLLAPVNLVMLYLIAVVLVTVRFGRGPGILASCLAVLAFDVFLVPPYYSLTVANTEYLITFAIMLAVSLIVSHLTASLRHQAMISHYRERRANALFELSKELSAALTYDQVSEIGVRHIESMFQTNAFLLFPDQNGKLNPSNRADAPAFTSTIILHTAQALFERHEESRFGDPVIAQNAIYVTLSAPVRPRGILVLALQKPKYLQTREQEKLLQTCAAQIALAAERVHYVDVAKVAGVAMESERLRNSLLSAISHDIRTPLTAIVGLASAFASHLASSSSAQKELAEAIQENALRMNSLVSNLLDMARLHAGTVQLNRQWQLLEEVVGSALAMMSSALESIDVEVTISPSLPLLEFDAVLMERVFCNLLDNAAKHGKPGGHIRIVAQTVGSHAQISVEDDGPGIPASVKETVFEKFMRGECESASVGVGLGLSICRTIIEAHGGRIWVDGHLESGARFVFTLPIGSPPAGEGLEA